MDQQTAQETPLQRAWSVYNDSHVAYKVIAGVFLAFLIAGLVRKPKQYRLYPAWAILELSLTSYVVYGGGWGRNVLSSIRQYGGSLFGLTSKHQVLINFPGIDRFMAQSFRTLNSEPVHYTFLTRVFGGLDSPDLKRKFDKSWKDLLGPVERVFLNDAATVAALEKADVPLQAASFVTFSSDPERMRRWERAANIKVVTPPVPGKQSGAAEVSLQCLARDFGACIATPLLYGKDFLDRYPQLLEDVWKFDNDLFPLLMIGIPQWVPFKVMKEGRATRARILGELEGLYRRVQQYERGEAVDFGADMSDISSAAVGRSKVYDRDGWSFAERAGADMSMLLGLNVNTQPLFFWLLTYIYSTPGLVGRVRDEIAPYVTLSQTSTPEITAMDLSGLSRSCQLLKACIFETYRMANEANSLRHVERPITVVDGNLKHELKRGTFVSAPHSLIQRDPAVFADPDTFIPERFLEADTDSGKPVARYGRLRPWGSGAAMCKGRTFAEKQLVSMGAAIISLWDISPVGGEWELPSMMPGPGGKEPSKDVRVLVTRRSVE